jgi:hypothetical protein
MLRNLSRSLNAWAGTPFARGTAANPAENMTEMVDERTRRPEITWFGLDLRSLAVFRVALGLVMLVDVLSRWSDFGAFYSTSGILPASAVTAPPPQFRLFLLVESDAVTRGLFALMVLAALVLIAGFASRAAALGCWLLTVSMGCRNPMVLNFGDQLLSLLLLWGCLLPLGARWSVDARRRPQPEVGIHLSSAAVGLQLQVVVLYLTAAMHKLRFSSWRDGVHLQWTLDRLDYVRPFGRWFGETLPGLLPWLTWSVLAVQIVFGVLLLLPYRWWRLRLLVLAAFAGLQLGMASMLYVGLFSVVSIVATLGLIPPGAWDWAAARLPATSSRMGAARTVAESALERGCRYVRSSAGLALVLLLGVLALNGHGAFPQLTDALKGAARQLHMRQDWRMFSTLQPTQTWYTVEATLADGRKVDLLRNGGAVSHERPAGIYRGFRGHHWREIFVKYIPKENMGVLRENFLRWEARRWQRYNPQEAVQSLDLVMLSYPVELPQMPNNTKVLASVKL